MRSPASRNTFSSTSDRPEIVSGPTAGRARPVNRGMSLGGLTGSPSISWIGVTRPALLPKSPTVAEIAPALRIVPSASGQYTGDPEKPSAIPVPATAGPDTPIRIRAP